MSDLVGASQAGRTAERILQALDTPLRLGKYTVVTATSIGIIGTAPRPRAVVPTRSSMRP